MLCVAVVAFALSHPPQNLRSLVGEFRYDAVELVRTGKSVVGAASLFEDRYAYRYFFSEEKNRREFLARPHLYEIQFGGGCGKMGSLSGRGSPDRFAVYKGKIYVFASDGCRRSFLADPEKHIERDDERPTGNAAEARAGRALLAKVVAWAGGASAWRAQSGLQMEVRENMRAGNTDYDHRLSLAVLWPDHILRTDRWNESSYGDLLAGGKGFFLNARDTTPMDPQQMRALQRVRNHWLPSVLKAAAGGTVEVFDRGPRADGTRRLDAYFDRTWVALEVVPDAGEVKAIEFWGRREPHAIERHAFSAFETKGSLRLPSAWEVHFDGKRERQVKPGQATYSLSTENVSFSLPGQSLKGSG